MRKRWVGVVLALACLAFVSADQAPTIRAADAKSYIGRDVLVEDAVAQVNRDEQSGFTYVNFGAPFPNQVLSIVIPAAVRERIAASVLASAWLRVRGLPRLDSRGIPEILCAEPDQITAIPARQSTAPVPLLPQPATPAPTRSCCRICTTGKACGNSCINRNYTCRQPVGCACNG